MAAIHARESQNSGNQIVRIHAHLRRLNAEFIRDAERVAAFDSCDLAPAELAALEARWIDPQVVRRALLTSALPVPEFHPGMYGPAGRPLTRAQYGRRRGSGVSSAPASIGTAAPRWQAGGHRHKARGAPVWVGGCEGGSAAGWRPREHAQTFSRTRRHEDD